MCLTRPSCPPGLRWPHGLRDPRDPRRPGARPHDGRRGDADLPDVDVRAGGGRRPQGLRLRARREPHADGARGVPRLARERRARPCLLFRPRRDDVDHAPARPGRPRRLRQRRVRRHLPDVLAGLRAQGLPLHVRHAGRALLGGHDARRRRAPRLDRVADQPAPERRRHRGRRGGDTGGRRPARRRQHVRDAVPPAAARARSRRRGALDDQVPRRPLRCRRRLRRDERPHGGRAPALPAEVARSRARAVRRLARPPGREDARGADGPPLRERARRRGVPLRACPRDPRPLARASRPSRPRDRRAPDAGLRRHGLLPRRDRGGGGRARRAGRR